METIIATGERTRTNLVEDKSRHRATLITQSFPPETHAGANRALAMANALAESCELTVLAPMPSHPTPDRFSGTDITAHDRPFSYDIRRAPAFQPHTSGYLRRGIREAAMAASLVRMVSRSTDIIVATTPSFFIAPAAFLASRIARTRFYWDIRDLTWEYALEALRDLPERQRLRTTGSLLMRSIASSVSHFADGVIASNSGIAEYFESRFGCDNVHVSRNGVSQVVYDDLGRTQNHSGSNSEFSVTYIGAIGYFQALDTLLDAAEKLTDVQFRLVGDGPDRQRLSQAATDRELDNLTLTGFVDRNRVYEEYASADVLFAQLRSTSMMGSSTVPSKVYEYLAAGKPVIYGGTGITADLLEQSRAAIVVKPQNMVELVDAIIELRDDHDRRRRMGTAGREFARTRIREVIMRDAAKRIVCQRDDQR